MVYVTKKELVERGYKFKNYAEYMDGDTIRVEEIKHTLDLPPNPYIRYKGVKGKIKDLNEPIKTQRRGYSFFVSNQGMYKLILMGTRGIVKHSGEFISLAPHLNQLSYQEYYDACKSLYYTTLKGI